MRTPNLNNCIRYSDILELMQPLKNRTRVPDAEIADDYVVVEGRFNLHRLRSGLMLHATDSIEKSTLPVEIEHTPCLSVFLILDGGIEFEVENTPFCFGNPEAEDGHMEPEGWLLSIAEATTLIRKSNPGTHTRKIFISIDQSWLEGDFSQGDENVKDLYSFSSRHLATARWKPSMRALSLAEQILNPPEMAPFLKTMYLESRAMEIAVEAFQNISGKSNLAGYEECPTRKMLRMQSVKSHIDTHLDKSLSLTEIAAQVNLSVSSLQRHFKSAYGTTVVDYIRAEKLALAREAIEKEGMSVSEAAFVAGYTNSSSFTTAFKRAYGISPGSLRN